MRFVWDEPKWLRNLARHGLDFRDPERCDRAVARVTPSYRGGCGERRVLATLPLGDDLVSIAFAPLGAEALSVISMRRASRAERRSYVHD